MSDQERAEIILRLVQERKQLREDRELLKAELARVGVELRTIGDMLNSYAGRDALYHLNRLNPDYDFPKLRARITDYISINERALALDESLKAAGI